MEELYEDINHLKSITPFLFIYYGGACDNYAFFSLSLFNNLCNFLGKW